MQFSKSVIVRRLTLLPDFNRYICYPDSSSYFKVLISPPSVLSETLVPILSLEIKQDMVTN